MIVIIFFLLIIGVIYYYKYLKQKNKQQTTVQYYKPNMPTNYQYRRKPIMTANEYHYFELLKDIANELNLEIHPQTNLATIIKKEGYYKYQNELYRNIDFAIFTKDYKHLLLLIEIDDYTHTYKSRIKRDERVKKICQNANIQLIRFCCIKSDTRNYIKWLILKKLSDNDSNIK